MEKDFPVLEGADLRETARLQIGDVATDEVETGLEVVELVGHRPRLRGEGQREHGEGEQGGEGFLHCETSRGCVSIFRSHYIP